MEIFMHLPEQITANKSRWLKAILPVMICFAIIISPMMPVFARSLDEVNTEINKKNSELNNLSKGLSKAEQELKAARQVQNSASGEVAKLQAEIDSIEANLNYNQLKLEEFEQQRELKKLQKEEMEGLQDLQVDASYKSWKVGDYQNTFFGGGDFVKNAIYNEAVTSKSHGGILGIATEIQNLDDQYQDYYRDSKELQEEMEELDKKKSIAEAKLSEIQGQVAQANKNVSQMRTQASAIQSQIEQLTKEQQDLQNAENNIVKGGSGGATAPLQTGEYYFTGTGRDLYQGHGVGMSQYGALGAALKGWDYKKIVQFYFPGTVVNNSVGKPATINVDGVGQVKTEDYVAGAGEVPDKSCEDLGVAFNPNNIWACWPREAIKAQMVVYRTYGVRRSGFVYRDTRGQVYKGGQNKKWAADATKGETVNYNGGFADVYYSSDNNQGKGNANNDTIWSNLSGDGTPKPYLRSVNDNSFAFKSQWTNWSWRTNSYSLKEVDNMLTWSSTSSAVSSSTRAFITSVHKDIGTLQSISFERDPSNRVKKVVLNGSKGQRKIAGWVYKSIWNLWVGNVKPSGQQDYIYSLTFYWNRK